MIYSASILKLGSLSHPQHKLDSFSQHAKGLIHSSIIPKAWFTQQSYQGLDSLNHRTKGVDLLSHQSHQRRFQLCKHTKGWVHPAIHIISLIHSANIPKAWLTQPSYQRLDSLSHPTKGLTHSAILPKAWLTQPSYQSLTLSAIMLIRSAINAPPTMVFLGFSKKCHKFTLLSHKTQRLNSSTANAKGFFTQ